MAEIVGAFEVLNKRNGVFNEEDEEVLKSLAAQSAIAIQTARSIGALTEENANLRREVEGAIRPPSHYRGKPQDSGDSAAHRAHPRQLGQRSDQR